MKRTSRTSAASRRGLSIIEILIVSCILIVIMGMAFQAVSYGLRWTAEGGVKVELQQQAVVALNNIVGELQKTTSGGVSLVPPATVNSPSITCVNPIYELDSNGFPVYEPKVVIFWYDPAISSLKRKSFPPPTTPAITFTQAAPVHVSSSNLNTIIGQVNDTERFLARNVTYFLTQSTGAGLYQVSLILEKDVPGTQRKSVAEFMRKVYLRNN